MAITLPKLPFEKNALAPHISEKTIEFHHGKHHNAYVEKTNALIKGTDLEGQDLEAIIKKSSGDASKAALFNNAAQVWNHSFYWQCMRPGGGGKPSGAVAGLIDKAFGSYDKFIEQFKDAGVTQFGSGWAWLVIDEAGKLAVNSTANQDSPISVGQIPILGLDVWEHAYYLKYQNRRPEYIENWWNVVDWDSVNELYQSTR